MEIIIHWRGKNILIENLLAEDINKNNQVKYMVIDDTFLIGGIWLK